MSVFEMDKKKKKLFSLNTSFCPHCGSVLPQVGIAETVACYSCKRTINRKCFDKMELEYTIHFNSKENNNMAKKKDDSAGGPIADRICQKCGHNKMSYAALQLRSADEGHTIFYTCLKCKATESENA